MHEDGFEPLTGYVSYAESEMQRRASQFYEEIKRRRTVRDFSTKSVPVELIEQCIAAAGTAPNGANLQPWHFAIVSSANVKKAIREKAEAEERQFYQGRAPDAWLEALHPLGTDEHKPFLETAPHLIVIFGESYAYDSQGNKIKNYYVNESVGIATGFLIAALHHAGLATLTHTPSPMKFLNEILERPAQERPFLVLVVGYPAPEAQVPKIRKKTLNEIVSHH